MKEEQIEFSIEPFVGDEWREPEAPSGVDVLRFLKRDDTWHELSIVASGRDFPQAHLSFHDSNGFVLQCYEDETSRSDFLVTRPELSEPSIEIDLGGQARERWPAELFVSEALAAQAIDYFLATGTQESDLEWVGISEFPRETVWEGREERDAWRRSQGLPPLPEARSEVLEAILKRLDHSG